MAFFSPGPSNAHFFSDLQVRVHTLPPWDSDDHFLTAQFHGGDGEAGGQRGQWEVLQSKSSAMQAVTTDPTEMPGPQLPSLETASDDKTM